MLTCLGSPFFPPIVVDMMWPVGSFPSTTGPEISCKTYHIRLEEFKQKIQLSNDVHNIYKWSTFQQRLVNFI